MRFVLPLAAVLAVATFAHAQTVQITAPGVGICVNGGCVPAPPTIIYQPRVVYQPQMSYQALQYQGTTIQPRTYATPLRNRWFGRYRVQHTFAPATNGTCINGNCK